jgi:hypothetical protein
MGGLYEGQMTGCDVFSATISDYAKRFIEKEKGSQLSCLWIQAKIRQ